MTSKSLSNLSAKHHTDNKMTKEDDILANFKNFCKRRSFWCEPVNELIMKYVAVVPERIIRREKAKILKWIGTVINERIRDNEIDFHNFGLYYRTTLIPWKLETLLRDEQEYYHPPPFKFKVGMILRCSALQMPDWTDEIFKVIKRTRHFVVLINGSLPTMEFRKKIRERKFCSNRFGRRIENTDEYVDCKIIERTVNLDRDSHIKTYGI